VNKWAEKHLFATKPRNNRAEIKAWEALDMDGWEIARRGWPDYLCWKDGKVIAVEVKPRRHHALRRDQRKIMFYLQEAGVPCYRWSPDTGLQSVRITESDGKFFEQGFYRRKQLTLASP